MLHQGGKLAHVDFGTSRPSAPLKILFPGSLHPKEGPESPSSGARGLEVGDMPGGRWRRLTRRRTEIHPENAHCNKLEA